MSTNHHVYYINSREKLSGTNSNFNYNLDLPNEVDRVSVLQLNIPKSFYLVTHDRNRFIIDENGVETEITIPVGNYSALSFRRVLSQLLESANYTYTIEFSLINGKFTFTVSNNVSQPIFKFNEFSYIADQLGFEINQDYHFVADKLISADTCIFQRSTSIYLLSDICVSTNSHNGANTLQEVLISNVQDYSVIEYENKQIAYNNKQIYSNKKNIFRFVIIDDRNEIIDLNGQHVRFSIVCYKS